MPHNHAETPTLEESSRKRCRDEFENEEPIRTVRSPEGDIGVGATLAYLKGGHGDVNSSGHDHENWETVKRQSKKRRKSKAKQQKTSHQDNPDGSTKVGHRVDGNRPALTVTDLHRIQCSLKIQDLQSLVLYCLADGISPQWISVQHHQHIQKAVVLLVPGLERDMFKEQSSVLKSGNGTFQDGSAASAEPPSEKNDPTVDSSSYQNDQAYLRSPDNYLPVSLSTLSVPTHLQPLAQIFDKMWPVKAPGDDKYSKVHSPVHAMLSAALTKSKEEKSAAKYHKGPNVQSALRDWKNQPTSITSYLASKDDLLNSNYVLHSAQLTTEEERSLRNLRSEVTGLSAMEGWKQSVVEELAPIESGSTKEGGFTQGWTVLAMDCEMCKVSDESMALTRISVIAWEGTVVMDELVKPELPIIDYLTAYSGITEGKLSTVTTTLEDIQNRLLIILTPNTILIGHSLDADMNALKLAHPYIVDTSILYPHPRGPPLKSSLKWLAKKYLNREIQKGHGASGHDSIEDARACLDLVRVKCEKGPAWGTAEASFESIFRRLERSHCPGEAYTDKGRSGAVVDHGVPERGFGNQATVCLACQDDDQIVKGVERTVKGDPDGREVRGGGVDFIWARLNDLELARGWSKDQRRQIDREKNVDEATPQLNTGNPGQAVDWKSRFSDAVTAAASRTIGRISNIHALLPPCTLFIVYSGTGDPHPLIRYQEMRATFQREYKTKKWDECSIKWGDEEDIGMRAAARKAREGVGFICVT
ncbi:hypothetical protein MMC25_007162 [Agyrium rufum]|nr:hypothetical protein [Agyrium rufum]